MGVEDRLMSQLQLQGSSSLHTMVPLGIYPDDEGERGRGVMWGGVSCGVCKVSSDVSFS